MLISKTILKLNSIASKDDSSRVLGNIRVKTTKSKTTAYATDSYIAAKVTEETQPVGEWPDIPDQNYKASNDLLIPRELAKDMINRIPNVRKLTISIMRYARAYSSGDTTILETTDLETSTRIMGVQFDKPKDHPTDQIEKLMAQEIEKTITVNPKYMIKLLEQVKDRPSVDLSILKPTPGNKIDTTPIRLAYEDSGSAIEMLLMPVKTGYGKVEVEG